MQHIMPRVRACLRRGYGLRRNSVFFAALFANLLMCWATEAQIAARPSLPMVTQPINDNNLVVLAGNTRPEARLPANDQGPAADVMPLPHMMLQLRRPAAQEQALVALIDQLHDRASLNYHHWLTAAEIGERFGPAPSDIQAVTGWLSANGFAVNTVYTNGMAIDFSGTAGQIRSAFHTEIHHLLVDGVAHYANVSDPQIPAALAPVVVGIASLHDFRPTPEFVHRDARFDAERGPTETDGVAHFITPGDLATIYNFKPAWARGALGGGQTVYLIEDSNLYALTDWSTFRTAFNNFNQSQFGLGSLTQEHPAPPSGSNNCSDPGINGDDAEATLDAEYAAAAAPDANIVMAACANTGTPTSGLLIAVQNLTNGSHPPAIISISYGWCEAADGASMNAAINTVFQTGVAEGASIYVSAGDQGASVCTRGGSAKAPNTENTGIGVNAWASTPYNVAVGGTDFQDTYLGENSTYWNVGNAADWSSAKSYIPEIPWDSTCASQEFATSKGTSDILDFCNGVGNPFIASNQFYLTDWAGSGGPSGCATGVASVPNVVSGTCAGYAKPSWQSLVGVPSDGVRDLPDVSLFSSFQPWGHSYIICFSDTTVVNGSPRNLTGVPCTASPSGWSFGWGGTSFAAPIWAGIQALINETNRGPQGNPNYRLYRIAAAEYGQSADEPCSSNGNPQASCVFYDVTVNDTAVPCTANSGTYYNCYRRSNETYGLISTNNNTYAPAFGATFGWDFATGIGTVNVANLTAIWSPKTDSHDFENAGVSDILWRQNGTGETAIWLMVNGHEGLAENIAQVPTTWSVVGTRDFDGDGKADILWRDTSGNLAIWLMNTFTMTSGINLGNVATQWSVAGTADFNGDGTGDILWRNTQSGELAIWMMKNGQFSSGVDFGQIPTVWQVAGTGDFNGDGIVDILWHNTQTGDMAIWLLNLSGQLASAITVGSLGASTWSVVGTGDFDNDGISDILWRDASGNLAIWLMSNGQFSAGATLGQVPTAWSVAETGDFDGDGKSDILWLDNAGNLGEWLMNGVSVGSRNSLGNVGTSWQVQGQNAD